MNNWKRYGWLIAVCGLLAPIIAGLLIGVIMILVKYQDVADIIPAFVISVGFALFVGVVPGLVAGLVLAFIHSRGKALGLPLIVAIVIASLAIFFYLLFQSPGDRFTADTTSFTAVFAGPALAATLSVVVLWVLRRRLWLGWIDAR